MKNPSELKYSREHAWVKLGENRTATIGITHHAQDSMGEISYVELPEIGKGIEKEQYLCSISSAKAFVDLVSPISGEVIAINENLELKPTSINESPYGDGWLLKLNISNPEEMDDLMDDKAYEAFVISETT